MKSKRCVIAACIAFDGVSWKAMVIEGVGECRTAYGVDKDIAIQLLKEDVNKMVSHGVKIDFEIVG